MEFEELGFYKWFEIIIAHSCTKSLFDKKLLWAPFTRTIKK